MFLLAGIFLFSFKKNKLLSTEMQQQRMVVVLYLGFWFCLKQSGQRSVLPRPHPRKAHANPIMWLLLSS